MLPNKLLTRRRAASPRREDVFGGAPRQRVLSAQQSGSVDYLEVKRLWPPAPTGGHTAVRRVLYLVSKQLQHFTKGRRPISSNPEVTGPLGLPSTRIPRWTAWRVASRAFIARRSAPVWARPQRVWGTIRGFIRRHRVLSTVAGAVFLGLFSGFGRVFGQYFAEEVLAWITMRF